MRLKRDCGCHILFEEVHMPWSRLSNMLSSYLVLSILKAKRQSSPLVVEPALQLKL